ncbi:hypothetical protein TWF281_004633 [Arthrobotrys megalospora]
MLLDALKVIDRTIPHYLCAIRSPHEDVGDRPLTRKQDATTHNNYINVMCRFVAFICSVSQDNIAGEAGLNPTAYQPSLDRILDLPAKDELKVTILDLIIEALSTPLPSGENTRLAHPFMSFLAVLGFDEEAMTWRGPELCTRNFAALSFTARICILQHCWNIVDAQLENGDPDGLFGELFHEMRPMTRTIRYGTYLLYKCNRFDLYKHRDLVKSLGPELSQLLRKLMLLNEEEELRLLALGDLADDPSHTAQGFTFSKHVANTQSCNPSALLEKILSDQRLRAS